MSIFSSYKKGEPSKSGNVGFKDMKSINAAALSDKNKAASIAFLMQEKDMLKVTLDHMIKENLVLKNQIEDMKLTVQHNKLQLKEYVESITNKDKVVEKMNNTIELLQARLAMYESFQKNKNSNDMQNSTKNNSNLYCGTFTDNFNDLYNANVQLSCSKVGLDHSLVNNIVNSTSQMENSMQIALKPHSDMKKNLNFYHRKNKSSNINSSNAQTNTGVSEQDCRASSSNIDKLPASLFKGHFNDNQLSMIKASQSTNVSPNSSFVAGKTPSIDNKSTLHNFKKPNNEFKVITENWNFNQIYTADTARLKEIVSNQHKILEEILNMKNDMQFLMENSTISRAKIKDKLNSSLMVTASEDKQHTSAYNCAMNATNNDQFNTTVNLNKSGMFNHTINENKSNYNLEDRTNCKRSVLKFQEFLEEFDLNKNVLILVDGQGGCWELVKRPDIISSQLKDGDSVVSILNKEYENLLFTNKILNIEMKEHDEDFHNSAIDISRVNDSILN